MKLSHHRAVLVALAVLRGFSLAAQPSAAPPPGVEPAGYSRGHATYDALCAHCHGVDGRGAQRLDSPAGYLMAPRLAGSVRVTGHRDQVINVILHGMAGPVDGIEYQDVMSPLSANPDQWIAEVVTYIRNAFGNEAPEIRAADVARVRTATGRRGHWTAGELEARFPRLLPAAGWKTSSSHPAAGAAGALTAAGWSAGMPLREGMWFQVELPAEVTIADVEFTSGPAGAAMVVGLAANGRDWTTVGTVTTANETAALPLAKPVRAKFVRITARKFPAGASGWSLRNLRLYTSSSQPGP